MIFLRIWDELSDENSNMVYDDNIVLSDEEIKQMKEEGYIYIRTLHGEYLVESQNHFKSWANEEGGEEPPLEPEEDKLHIH